MFRIIVALAAVVTVLALVSVAAADSAHFKKGSPSAVKDNGLTFSQTASVAGLGNGDIVVTLSITNVQPTARCVNPAGQTKVPGQNPAPTTAIGRSRPRKRHQERYAYDYRQYSSAKPEPYSRRARLSQLELDGEYYRYVANELQRCYAYLLLRSERQRSR